MASAAGDDFTVIRIAQDDSNPVEHVLREVFEHPADKYLVDLTNIKSSRMGGGKGVDRLLGGFPDPSRRSYFLALPENMRAEAENLAREHNRRVHGSFQGMSYTVLEKRNAQALLRNG